ncbi:hypothetical protein HS7_18570 [Sulfolobales archaeon HS-7]|nr:hypothetical protein HS7_18570 [Sulfolobales archaeon HS-7]
MKAFWGGQFLSYLVKLGDVDEELLALVAGKYISEDLLKYLKYTYDLKLYPIINREVVGLSEVMIQANVSQKVSLFDIYYAFNEYPILIVRDVVEQRKAIIDMVVPRGSGEYIKSLEYGLKMGIFQSYNIYSVSDKVLYPPDFSMFDFEENFFKVGTSDKRVGIKVNDTLLDIIPDIEDVTLIGLKQTKGKITLKDMAEITGLPFEEVRRHWQEHCSLIVSGYRINLKLQDKIMVNLLIPEGEISDEITKIPILTTATFTRNGMVWLKFTAQAKNIYEYLNMINKAIKDVDTEFEIYLSPTHPQYEYNFTASIPYTRYLGNRKWRYDLEKSRAYLDSLHEKLAIRN